MAHSNTPANVKAQIIECVALAALGASFTGGLELGMQRTAKLTATPNAFDLNMGNPWTDSYNVLLEVDGAETSIAKLSEAYAYSQTYVQAVCRSTAGEFFHFKGANSNAEGILGVGFDFSWKGNETILKWQFMTQMSRAAWQTAHATTTTDEWDVGLDEANALRSGVKRVLIGGVEMGQLISCEGNLKSRSQNNQLGRPLCIGIDATCKIVGSQNAHADADAAMDTSISDDTIIIEFWNGESIKFTNLFGGKTATLEYGPNSTVTLDLKCFFPKGATRIDMTSVATTCEFIYLNNGAQSS